MILLLNGVGGTRTHTGVNPVDFKSTASANSATTPICYEVYQRVPLWSTEFKGYICTRPAVLAESITTTAAIASSAAIDPSSEVKLMPLIIISRSASFA